MAEDPPTITEIGTDKGHPVTYPANIQQRAIKILESQALDLLGWQEDAAVQQKNRDFLKIDYGNITINTTINLTA